LLQRLPGTRFVIVGIDHHHRASGLVQTAGQVVEQAGLPGKRQIAAQNTDRTALLPGEPPRQMIDVVIQRFSGGQHFTPGILRHAATRRKGA